MKLSKYYFLCTICTLQFVVIAGVMQAQTPATPPPAYLYPVNFVRTWDALSPQTDPNTLTSATVQDVRQSTQYVDGLGRPIQMVVKQGSLRTSTGANVDLVTPIVYDVMGREQFEYLPFASNVATSGDVVNDGSFKADAFQQQVAFYNSYLNGQSSEISGGLNWAYSKTTYEASPLGREINSFAPGVGWAGSESGSNPHSVRHQYLSNTGSSGDNVQLWTCAATAGAIPTSGGAYVSGQLEKNITVDESGNQSVVYTDIEGKVILKQVQSGTTPGNNHSGWLNTYYIYDNLDNLRYVLQPQAVQLLLNSGSWNLSSNGNLLTGLAFYYEYDLRNRMTVKREPGAAPIYMVYDSRDRLVMSQDGNQRQTNSWYVQTYDNYNRVIKKGIYIDATPFATLQANANAAAIQSDGSSYPSTTSNFTLQEQHFYDKYDWLAGTPLSAGYSNTSSSNFSSAYSVFPYPRPVTQTTYSTVGLETGTMIKVVGTLSGYVNTTMYQSNFYDDHDRLIQSQLNNTSGGTDKKYIQYTFDGKELASNFSPSKGATNHQDYTILTTKTYDALERLTNIANQIIAPSVVPVKNIASHEYDEIGREGRKTLGGNLDVLTSEYNVRGWLTGVNRSYISSTAAPGSGGFFGFELAYDKSASIAAGNSYTPQFNGNIAGMAWKGAGDGVARKYDFNYDYTNRLTAANFNQNTSGTSWDHNVIDFTTDNLQYDPNGNITHMNQKGWQIGGSGYIDQLTYNYLPASNQVQNVIDASNLSTTTLGDFRYSPAYSQTFSTPGNKPVTATDYSYNSAGGLTSDKNKDITNITYNFLNLPQTVTTSKGTISYVYGANGDKIQKIVQENNVQVAFNGTSVTSNLTSVTTYLSGFVYQTLTYQNPALVSLNYFDKLAFFPHEEGRIRPFHTDAVHPTWVTGWAYDFFEKDHLGNTRLILTDEVQTDIYPPSSLEGTFSDASTAVGYEKNYYSIDPTYLTLRSSITGISNYTNSNGVGTNLYPSGNSGNTNSGGTSTVLYKINGGVNKVGLGMTLKVMAGDKIDIFGKSYYFSNNANDNVGYNIPVLTLLSGFLGSPGAGAATAGHPATASQLNGISSVNSNISSYLTNPSQRTAITSTTPRAYVNYIFFDEQFNYSGGGFATVGSPATVTDYASIPSMHNIPVPKSGYVYVYCSNESPVDVFFDNIQVVHTRGPVLEENHYYPYGLTMAGISDKTLKSQYAQNLYRYGGKELQNKEFSDGSGLELADYGARMYDVQLGRWHIPDPLSYLTEDMSPYKYAVNNPVAFVDVDGLKDTVINGQVIQRDRDLQAATVTPAGSFANSAGGIALDFLIRDGVDYRGTYYKPGISRIARAWQNGEISDATYSMLRYQMQSATKMQYKSALAKLLGELPPTGKPLWLQKKLAYDVAFNGAPIPEGASKTRALTSLLAKPQNARILGRGLLVASAAMSIYNIATSDNKVRATAHEAGGWAGAWGGAAFGVEIGALIGGPFAPITGAIGGVVFGAIGYFHGSQIGDAIYDDVTGHK
ncbi:MAG: hypothetical protein JST68_00565 [Bacteroidetes bacterium]|nr:hypothetical protein [Bacteroidota bacterium]